MFSSKSQGTTVLVSGCFNILHAGHVELLEFASKFGSVVVGVNADPYLRKKYGDLAVPLLNRTYVLKSNRFVDKVVVFSEDDPSELIRKLRPDIYVKGPDYSGEELPEQAACDAVGTRVLIHHDDKIHDSSELIHSASESIFQPLSLFD